MKDISISFLLYFFCQIFQYLSVISLHKRLSNCVEGVNKQLSTEKWGKPISGSDISPPLHPLYARRPWPRLAQVLIYCYVSLKTTQRHDLRLVRTLHLCLRSNCIENRIRKGFFGMFFLI